MSPLIGRFTVSETMGLAGESNQRRVPHSARPGRSIGLSFPTLNVPRKSIGADHIHSCQNFLLKPLIKV